MTPDQLLPRVYDELRKLASAKMRHEAYGHTLDATALVNEAWLKLNGDSFSSPRADLDPDRLADSGVDPDHWLNLDEALNRFEGIDPIAADLVKLRVFGGMSVEEAGDALGLSRATAFRTWTYARAWLTTRLAEEPGEKFPVC